MSICLTNRLEQAKRRSSLFFFISCSDHPSFPQVKNTPHGYEEVGVSGPNLTNWCRLSSLPDPEFARYIIKYTLRIMEPLMRLCNIGFHHGNIYPSNIIISADGEPVLVGWGEKATICDRSGIVNVIASTDRKSVPDLTKALEQDYELEVLYKSLAEFYSQQWPTIIDPVKLSSTITLNELLEHEEIKENLLGIPPKNLKYHATPYSFTTLKDDPWFIRQQWRTLIRLAKAHNLTFMGWHNTTKTALRSISRNGLHGNTRNPTISYQSLYLQKGYHHANSGALTCLAKHMLEPLKTSVLGRQRLSNHGVALFPIPNPQGISIRSIPAGKITTLDLSIPRPLIEDAYAAYRRRYPEYEEWPGLGTFDQPLRILYLRASYLQKLINRLS